MVSDGDPKESFLVLWIHCSQYYILLRKLIKLLSPNLYEVCPESKDAKVLNLYNIFNLKKRHCK